MGFKGLIAVFSLLLAVYNLSFGEGCKYCIPENSNISCEEIDRALKRVNQIRAEVGTPPLKWDCNLAKESQKWAEILASQGRLKHSSPNNYGENLYFYWNSGGKVASLEDAVNSWYSEKAYFVYGAKNWCKPGKICGHYTQLIWKDTTHMGCGKAFKNNSTYVVCRFTPQGNLLGKQPY